jgi:Family of unknown function (DUF5714)
MNGKSEASSCIICGAELHELKSSASLACVYCGAEGPVSRMCPEGHYICRKCRGWDAVKMIEAVVFTTTLKDPVRIAELMIGHPALPQLGCEHAFIAAGAFMAALRNSPYGKEKIADGEIREVFNRTARQSGDGSCARTGVCGITAAVGACFSVFLGAHCGSDREQRITMEAAIEVAKAISELTGPSCCKAYVRSALAVAVALFGERFGIHLPTGGKPIVCSHGAKHPSGCREEKCPYFQKPKDIFSEGVFVTGTACTA